MALSREEIERAKFTFSIYDFDGTEKMDAFQLGHALRAMGLYPSLKKITNLGGTIRRNEKTLTVEEFLAIYQDAKKDKDEGTIEDYIECLKSHDKDLTGKLSVAQLGHLLQAYGEKLDRDESDEIISECGNANEDMVDYKVFIKNLLRGPENKATSPVRESRSIGRASEATKVSSATAGAKASRSPSPPPKAKQTSTGDKRGSTDTSSTTDTSGGDISKVAQSLKTGKARNSSGTPEVKVKEEAPPVKAKFQQPLISLKTDGLFGKKK